MNNKQLVCRGVCGQGGWHYTPNAEIFIGLLEHRGKGHSLDMSGSYGVVTSFGTDRKLRMIIMEPDLAREDIHKRFNEGTIRKGKIDFSHADPAKHKRPQKKHGMRNSLEVSMTSYQKNGKTSNNTTQKGTGENKKRSLDADVEFDTITLHYPAIDNMVPSPPHDTPNAKSKSPTRLVSSSMSTSNDIKIWRPDNEVFDSPPIITQWRQTQQPTTITTRHNKKGIKRLHAGHHSRDLHCTHRIARTEDVQQRESDEGLQMRHNNQGHANVDSFSTNPIDLSMKSTRASK